MFLLQLFFACFFSTVVSANLVIEKKIVNIDSISLVEIKSTINPAVFEHLKNVIKKISNQPNSLLLIKMTTPGGLVSTTKEILNLFGESRSAIVVWIAPVGSSATSAGALIASGAHYLYMSEGTNIGAATPITLSGDIGKDEGKSDSRSKAVNDLVALVTSLCELRGRNATAYAEMISEAKSFSAKTAKEKNIIDNMSNSLEEIYQDINSRPVKIRDEVLNYQISKNVVIIKEEFSLANSLLNIFSSPEVAYVLFIIGAALIYFEMQAPGGFIAGSIGAISLILASVGFHILPINYAGMGLILISFILLVLEIYLTSFGLLAITALVTLTFGSLILFETPDSLVSLNRTVMISTIMSVTLTLLLITYYLFKTKMKKEKKDFFQPIGHTGVIEKVLPLQADGYWYMAKINGVLWQVTSKEKLDLGQKIKVDAARDGTLTLIISSQYL